MLTKKINDGIRIKPVKVPLLAPSKQQNIFPDSRWINCYILSKKRSGKTTLIYNIVKQMMKNDKDLLVFIFAPTAHCDPIYIKLQEPPKKKKQVEPSNFMVKVLHQDDHVVLPSRVVADDTLDNIKDLLEHRETPGNSDNDIVIIVDDMSTDMRKPIIDKLCKRGRHTHSWNLISTQYYADLCPSSRKQIDWFICFDGETPESLQEIHHDTGIKLPFLKFYELYLDATSEKYSPFVVDIRNGRFMKGFHEQYITEK